MLFSSPETLTEGQASGRKLPYTRFDLGVRPVLDSLPEGMENVPLQVWVDFWSKMDVVKYRFVLLYKRALLIFCLVVGIGFYLIVPASSDASVALFVPFILAYVLPLLVGLKYFHAYNFKRLKTFCSEEEAQTFLPLGFVLECHAELTYYERRKHRHKHKPFYYLYLYFIPITRNGNYDDKLRRDGMCCHRGYLRVQLFKDLSWNTSPALPYYDYLPSGIESVSLADWSEFWAIMDSMSSAAVSLKRTMYLIAIPAYLAISIMLSNIENVTGEWVSLLVCTNIVFLWFMELCKYLYFSKVLDIKIVCNRFARQGVHMEFRMEQVETVIPYCGGISDAGCYIYLFPIVHPYREEENAYPLV